MGPENICPNCRLGLTAYVDADMPLCAACEIKGLKAIVERMFNKSLDSKTENKKLRAENERLRAVIEALKSVAEMCAGGPIYEHSTRWKTLKRISEILKEGE